MIIQKHATKIKHCAATFAIMIISPTVDRHCDALT